jgi:hypothetical protein
MFVAFLACVPHASFTAHAAEIRTVALTGQQAAGLSVGANFPGFGLPVLNNVGMVAVRGFSSGSGPGIWSEVSGSLELVTRAEHSLAKA